MVSKNFVCAYLLDLCATNYYRIMLTDTWDTDTVKFADKPSDTLNNDYLDKLYAIV
jgi:hypothetical protein